MSPDPASPSRGRLDAIDLVRGLVMAVMLLDHVRDFTHDASLAFDPTDPARSWPALFATRWITHLCAPVFVLLAGVAIALQAGRKPRAELARFLWTRGLWLVVCEFTLVRVGSLWTFDYGAFLGMGQVIWALGVAMLAMAALVRLPRAWVGALGLAIVLGHNALDGLRTTDPAHLAGALWVVLHQGGFVSLGAHGPGVLFLYPVLPWIGVMACGYALGGVYGWEPARRRAFLVRLGLGMTAAFLLLRALNRYGDPHAWAHLDTGARTAMSFLAVEKYPPSLDYLLATLGPALALLGAVEGAATGAFGRWLVTLGRVPMAFYLLQWPTAHGLSVLFHALAGKPAGWLFQNPFAPGAPPPPPGAGFPLAWTYLGWALGLLLLTPACAWWADLKARRRDWWLSYL